MSMNLMRCTLLANILASTLIASASYAQSCVNADKSIIQEKAAPYQKTINKYAKQYRVDANLISSVIAIESCFNRKAVSPKGAQGLMQLIPDTAERFGIKDSFSADLNIKGGVRYLNFLQKRYAGDMRKVLAAYNAGEGKVDYYKGIPPYKETQNYVKHVLAIYTSLNPPKARAPEKRKPGRISNEELKRRAPHLFKQVAKPT
ncbi:MAG: Membrane-bound lytic murein transglycosylase D precursor (EC [uncultured Thiotrichaceae bacterium]|uniref:Membrane-bound lytic murein transglycosylase D (EC) n=1 Tax=uncultured Thiotrichaceae bacterium TaxID=298394 RepID=A0A6S6TCW2_9GAMM|nr:MAG: Membrane-bound lytic murein transglycosylase D precursor (EC [uncultured Thiotrichaceae bacterium]